MLTHVTQWHVQGTCIISRLTIITLTLDSFKHTKLWLCVSASAVSFTVNAQCPPCCWMTHSSGRRHSLMTRVNNWRRSTRHLCSSKTRPSRRLTKSVTLTLPSTVHWRWRRMWATLSVAAFTNSGSCEVSGVPSPSRLGGHSLLRLLPIEWKTATLYCMVCLQLSPANCRWYSTPMLVLLSVLTNTGISRQFFATFCIGCRCLKRYSSKFLL